MRIVVGAVPVGFTASLIVTTLLSGVQLLFLGVIGRYWAVVRGSERAPNLCRRGSRWWRLMDARYAAAYPELYRNHWWWARQEEILLRKIRGVLGGARNARIPDVGCGAGLFFDALEQFGRPEGH